MNSLKQRKKNARNSSDTWSAEENCDVFLGKIVSSQSHPAVVKNGHLIAPLVDFLQIDIGSEYGAVPQYTKGSWSL